MLALFLTFTFAGVRQELLAHCARESVGLGPDYANSKQEQSGDLVHV